VKIKGLKCEKNANKIGDKWLNFWKGRLKYELKGPGKKSRRNYIKKLGLFKGALAKKHFK